MATMQMHSNSIDQQQLERMAEAAVEVTACMRALAKSGCNLVGEVLRTAPEFIEWEHYPHDDVHDPETHAQYYFHAHPPVGRAFADYGHFHTFLRSAAFPKRVVPLAAPRDDGTPDSDPVCHLIAISMNREGLPVRLFTTNRWVTSEAWLPAAAVISILDRFIVDLALPSWPLNRWLGAMLVLFRPQIEQLLRDRDIVIERWREQNPGSDAFEDRRLEVTSSLEISLESQMGAVRDQIERACSASA